MMRQSVLAAGLIFLILSAVLFLLPEVVGKIANPTLMPETRRIQYNVKQMGTYWNVTWYAIKESGEWEPVGEAVFPDKFKYSWTKFNEVYKGYIDNIGFVARATVYMNRTGPAAFTLASGDGSILYVDSDVAIDLYKPHIYMEASVTLNQLSKGYHDLTIRYYERSGDAGVHFDCDQDLTRWEEKTNGYRDQIYYNFQVSYGKQTWFYGVAGIAVLIGLVLVVNGTTPKSREKIEGGQDSKLREESQIA